MSTEEKNRCLMAMAEALEGQKDAIADANAKDMEAAPGYGLTAAMMDRLRLDEKRIASMAKGLREVAALYGASTVLPGSLGSGLLVAEGRPWK